MLLPTFACIFFLPPVQPPSPPHHPSENPPLTPHSSTPQRTTLKLILIHRPLLLRQPRKPSRTLVPALHQFGTVGVFAVSDAGAAADGAVVEEGP